MQALRMGRSVERWLGGRGAMHLMHETASSDRQNGSRQTGAPSNLQLNLYR